VLLEIADPHLNRYPLPMVAEPATAEITAWRKYIQCAWRLLVEHHGWVSGALAEGVPVIVPTISRSRSDTDLDSATMPAAFGAVATSLPPDPVIMAETLVHEFQHLKLGAVMDLVRLIEPCDQPVYAPWRPDPRPAGGLLHGAYAHLGVARFWDVQRHVEAEPGEAFRAHLMYERWRPAIELSTSTLMRTGCLTPEGSRFVDMLREGGRKLDSQAVPREARELADDVALDHWLTWQLRHVATDARTVAELVAAYQRGDPPGDRSLPEARIEENVREVDSTVRSRMLNMRYIEPHRHIGPQDPGMPGSSEADALLFQGKAEAAVNAYRDEISAAAAPAPDAWVGLALATRRLDATPARKALVDRIPLLFDMHAALSVSGVRSDPLGLAGWLA
jgi:hypothetical protein